MADYRYPNRIRAYTAFLIYRDAMILFIEAALGPARIHQFLSDRNARMGELDQDIPVSDRIDQSHIPFLVGDHLHLRLFPGLNSNHVGQMHLIYKLWNDKIKHHNGLGDCKAEIADECADLCVRVLRRCDLNEAADEIASLSSSTPTIFTSVPAATTRKPIQPSHDIKPLSDSSTADPSSQLHRQAGFPHPAEHQLESSMAHDLVLRADSSVTSRGDSRGASDSKFKAVSAGENHSLGLREDGSVAGRGSNRDGRCDAPGGEFKAISAGKNHSLGLREDGSIECWGDNSSGQCEAPDGEFKAVSAGDHHSLGLREDGSIECWGGKGLGQCDAPGGKFTAVSAGGHHSLGLREDGSVECWGDERFRKCEAPDGKFTAISAGGHHSLGLREDGSVAGWGYNQDGQRNTQDGKFTAISAGEHHSLGLREDGSVAGWGWQEDGLDDSTEGNFFP